MRRHSLNEELDAIAHEFDYGIIPSSATVFVRDYENNIGRLDLTLLENVMVIIEVDNQGYKVLSCSPLSLDGTAMTTAQAMQIHLNVPFESMESLLMSISPMFCNRFQETLFQKLQPLEEQQQKESHPQHQTQHQDTRHDQVTFDFF